MEKWEFCGFLKSMFSLSIKAYFLYKTSKITIYFHHLLHWDSGGYKGWQEVTGGYKRLSAVTRGYKGSQGVKGGQRGLHRVIGGYKVLEKSFFLTRMFPESFSWSILHKKQRWRNLKLLTKTMDFPPGKNLKFAFFLKICSYCLLRLGFYLQSATKWVETFRPKLGFFTFY